MAGGSDGESVLSRVVRILEAFDAESPLLTVTDVSRSTGLPLPTVSRLVCDMLALGLLQRVDRRRLRIGIRLWELGSRAAPTLGLRDLAMPFMEDLHAAVGHSVQLAVRRDDSVLFVERLTAPGAVYNITKVAGRLPIHVSSAGLVLLAYGPTHLQQAVLAGPLRRYTAATPIEPTSLRSLLARVRRSGIAFCPGFVDDRATGIAVPLRANGKQVVAALSVVVPNDSTARAAIPALVAAGHGISRALGAPVQEVSR